MKYYGIWEPTDSLKHYGVLGMKWGVRRYQNKDGSLTSVGKKRNRNINPVKKAVIRTMKKNRREYVAAAAGGALSAAGLLLTGLAPVSIPMAAITGTVSLASTIMAIKETKEIRSILDTPMSEVYDG